MESILASRDSPDFEAPFFIGVAEWAIVLARTQYGNADTLQWLSLWTNNAAAHGIVDHKHDFDTRVLFCLE